MRKNIPVFALFLAPFLASPSHADFQLGAGANYWTSVGSINENDFDEDGLSYYLSLQIPMSDWVRIEAQFEHFDEGFGGSPDDVYAPQAFVILGGTIYAGAGIGGYYVDNDFLDDPFYVLRAGLNIELLPNVYLDVNANYRFENWDQVNNDNVNEDTITLGAAARIAL